MTAEQQQIAIAELLGWTHCRVYHQEGLLESLRGIPPGSGPHDVECYLPDTDDLNVLHEVEKLLPDRAEYALMLYRVCVNNTPDSYAHWSDIGDNTFDANAAQRCEAILRTIGKWTD